MVLSRTTEPGGVARLHFDNAARGNCLDDALLTELVEEAEAAAAEPGCSLVRLDMAGPHFCGGWDTTTFSSLASAEVDDVAAALRHSDELLERLRNLAVPVVAGVRGRVIGFGAGLLSVVHLPVVADDVRVSLPEARFGFAPAGVGHRVAQVVPRARALALLSGVAEGDAGDLLAWGWAAQVAAPSHLETTVDQLVEALKDVPREALRGVVDVVGSSLATGRPDQSYSISARTIVAALRTGGAS